MDWWNNNYGTGHSNTALELAYFGAGQTPPPGGFNGISALGSVATHIKTEVMPDSGDIIIVRSY